MRRDSVFAIIAILMVLLSKTAVLGQTSQQQIAADNGGESPALKAAWHTDDRAEWKDRRVYVGGGLGLGSYSCVDCERSTIVAVDVVADVALLSNLSIESGVMLMVNSEGAWGSGVPLIARLSRGFSGVELSADAGAILGAGFTLGGTVGVKARSGILYTKYSYTWDDSGVWLLSLGYKAGVGKRR